MGIPVCHGRGTGLSAWGAPLELNLPQGGGVCSGGGGRGHLQQRGQHVCKGKGMALWRGKWDAGRNAGGVAGPDQEATCVL